MFDRLVESGLRAQRRGISRFFIGATLIYSLALAGVGIGTVLFFNPGLAEAVELSARLAPPVPFTSTPLPSTAPMSTGSAAPIQRFVAPAPESAEIAREDLPAGFQTANPFPNLPSGRSDGNPCPHCKPGLLIGSPGGVIPPPPVTPTPTPPPAPTPTATPQLEPRKISEGVLRGNAIRKEVPNYPEMARRIRLHGAVRILVTISEEGRVIDASVIDGHPLLRRAALDAARLWQFNPTRLGSTPVKVQGILTFNFVMN